MANQKNVFKDGFRRNEMDVGIVTTHVPPAKGYGGVSVTCGVLTKAWAERGHNMALVAADESIDGRLRAEDVKLGKQVDVRLYRCYGFRRWGFGLGAISQIFKLCWQAPRLYIHGIATWPSTLAAVFCVLLRRPFMVAVHGGLMPEHVALIRRQKPHKWLFYKWLTFPTLRRAIAVHCTSDTEATGVTDVLGKNARVLLVPNGIDSRDFQLAGYPQGEGTQLCFLGHVQQEKGINAFIRAWLKTRRPNDRLVVAGRSVDGAYFEEFQDLLAQAQGAISYKGYLPVAEVKQLLADSHFLVAKGLAWDHLASYGAGLVFERNETSVCAVLRQTQLVNQATWQDMSLRSREYVEQQLDPVKLGDKVWKVLTKIEQDKLPQSFIEGSSYE
jgi:glycosyltransferase involved in cell wall biosynthesis